MTMSTKKIRHVCIKCGSKKYEIFMKRINDWHQGQWICANADRCSKDKDPNYRG